ncbi:MAG: phenylacetate--CoA ligase [Firmicutes bacterium]|nr:phenylacetate--CoA ligase [Bacillota bacterium]
MIWDKKEQLSREEYRSIQSERLQKTVQYAYERVPFYRRKMQELGLEPDDIKGLEDLEKLPVTSKEDLRHNYPFGLFAVPLEDVVRLHASSGTTGKPIVVGYTENDMETWTELVARMVTQAGVTRGDVAQICFGYGLFTGGFGLHYGLERVGATVIPASSGNTEKQLMLMEDFGTTVLVSTPSYALYLAEVAERIGLDPVKDLNVRLGLFGGEPWSESMRQEIESRWGMTATDNYGLSEIGGPGFAGECSCRCGMHISEDHFLVELVDPDTLKPLPPGSKGELLVTTLTKEAMPVIRYRTKDITRLFYEPCACGRTTVRMEKVTGRTDDMLIIRGVNVFPSQIEAVLMEVPGVSPFYQLVVEKDGYLDTLEVQVELVPEYFTDNYADLERLERLIEKQLYKVLSVTAKVKLLESGSIERTTGKAKRVIDKRPKLA